MISRLKTAFQLVRYFGARWVFYRASYAAQMRGGILQRRLPVYAWADRPLETWLLPGIPSEPSAYANWRKAQPTRFFFDSLPQDAGSENAVLEADAILAGCWRYFEKTEYVVGLPPNWLADPASGTRVETDRHWSKISDFAAGDIKLIWEASRFAVVFPLVRAYAETHDEHYPSAFWQLVVDWAARNPPQLGPNWKCGQEATFRVMAWCFGLYGFLESPQTTPERIAALTAYIAAHGERIEGNISYARSQKNNHGISEGVGLWTIGLLFPEFKRSAVWRDLGRRVIIDETRRQIYEDGAYVQHSIVYHRVMLHDCLWALRLGEVNQARLPDELYTQIGKASDFLYQLIDPINGNAPNYGANDGSLVLALTDCDYRDFRPVIQTTSLLCHEQRIFQPGAWDEEARWLLGEAALDKPQLDIIQDSYQAQASGYYTLRSPISWVFIRCAKYHDRPSHADQLHADLWWRGVNVACDAGTYLYNGAPPWDNRLSATEIHNTVTADGHDQMTRAGRFLWLDWSRGHMQRYVRSEHLEYWAGEQDGYIRFGIRHRRGILRIGDESWLIVDALTSDTAHQYRLHWLLQDFPYHHETQNLRLATPQGDYNLHCGSDAEGEISLIRGGEGTCGWVSRYYAEREPALSLALITTAQHCFFWTLFSPSASTVEHTSDTISVRTQDWHLIAIRDGLLQSIRVTGAIEDHLS